jgi:hypothetical protein
MMTAIRAKVDAFNAMIRDLREHDPAICFGNGPTCARR